MDLRPGENKLSTRLGELIAPHVGPSETRDSYHALVSLGAIAWNLAVIPESEREALIHDTVQDAVRKGLPLTDKWLSSLVQRKIDLFPSDDRFIQHFEVHEVSGGRFTIVVGSLRAG